MIEGLREILEIVKGMPELAIWVAAAFMIYKLAIWGSTVGAITVVAKLAINKLHDYKTKPQEIIKKYKIDRFFLDDETHKDFISMLSDLRQGDLKYIHKSDVKFMKDAIIEKEQRDV